MSDQSNIEWTDSTFNPWEGCTKVGPGCDHCYAEARNNRFQGGNWGPGAPRRRTSEANWRKPLKWDVEPFWECPDCGWRGIEKDSGMWKADDGETPSCPLCEDHAIIALRPARRRVFCASLADWLDNEVPIEWLVDLLDLIRQTPNLDWLLLTKRIGNWRSRIEAAIDFAGMTCNHHPWDWLNSWLADGAPENIWLGATIVNQEEADRDIPKLLNIPARVRFLSMEPLLGPVVLKGHDFSDGGHGQGWIGKHGNAAGSPTIDWVIAGGESGPHARPMHPDWVRSLRDQCQAAAVPFLFKQWGEWKPTGLLKAKGADVYLMTNGVTLPDADYEKGACPELSPLRLTRVGKKRAGRLLDGRTWDQFPVGAA